MLNTSLANWPSFTHEEADAVRNVMLSNKVNYWTGQEGREFEKEYADWVGTEHAIALGNGTLALDLALKGLGIGPGCEVIVTPRTFIASVSCVVTAGATPVFADVDADSGNLSAATIAAKLSPDTKAIIPVHIAGWPCEMGDIMDLARDRQLVVIEDCAQAHGASLDGRSVGSIGDVGAWSFCQDKIMTTGGEGGMVTTDNAETWSKMWSYKDHGKSWDAVYNRPHPPGFRWVHDSIGTNWRMLEMQAAIGRVQLRNMPVWTARRTEIALQIASTLNAFPGAVRVPLPREGATHAFYRLYAYVIDEGLKTGWNRDRIVADIVARGVPVFQGTCSEVYREKAFQGTAWQPAQRLPNALRLGETSMMFLTHPTITDSQIDRVCDTICAVLTEASR
jgi:dTDP-4-amino-4,6-dideoxygalactose transaminase